MGVLMRDIAVASLAEFEAFAFSMGQEASPGQIFLLEGDLGAGKTTFVRKFVKGIGSEGLVSSPTFRIVHQYPGPVPVVHMDLYRLNSLDEVLNLDLVGYLRSDSVGMIEWPGLIRDLLSGPVVEVKILEGETWDGRRIVWG